MDVSDTQDSQEIQTAPQLTAVSTDPELGGEALLQTVVSLTGLPETLVYPELDRILKLSPHKKGEGEVTLDELRAAMLAYLESCLTDETSENPHL